MRTLVYMGHPVSGDFANNAQNAQVWYTFLRGLSVRGIQELMGGRPERVVKAFRVGGGGMTSVYQPINPFEQPPVIICPWLACLVPDGEYPGGRKKAMSDCRAAARRCDEFWATGAWSEGMMQEQKEVQIVRDLTRWGALPPEWREPELFISGEWNFDV